MSKERIKEIQQRINDNKRKSGGPTEVLTWNGWESVLLVFTKDVEYLMERVQELEKQIKIRDSAIESASEITEQLVEENKHYKLIKERQEEEYISVYEQNKHYRELLTELMHEEQQNLEGYETEEHKKIREVLGLTLTEALEESE